MAMSRFSRMIIATVILILTVSVSWITYAIVVIPLEYTTDALQDSYTEISDDMGWDDSDDMNNSLGALPYFLAGGVVILTVLMFIWYFAVAHKKEYEHD
jgi:hypothetical protein